MIEVAEGAAPHGVMMDRDGMLWCTAELANAALAIDPATGAVETIDTEKAAHWLAVSHAADRVFASCKTSDFVAVIDRKTRRMTGKLPVPELAEGIAVSPDGATLFVCAHRSPTLYVFDTASLALTDTLAIAGGEGRPNQLKRVRVSPDGRYRLRVVAARQSLSDLRCRVADADRLDRNAEGADGLRLRRGRQARLSVLPRRRHGAGIRTRQRPRHAAISDRVRLRIRDRVLTLGRSRP